MDKIMLSIPCEIVKAGLRAAARFITGDEPQSKYLRIGLLLLADYAQPDGGCGLAPTDGTIFPGLVREVVVAHLLESARHIACARHLTCSDQRKAMKFIFPLREMACEIRDDVNVTLSDPMAPDYEALAAEAGQHTAAVQDRDGAGIF